MQHLHVPNSSVAKMLIDPGKLYVSLIVDLQNAGLSDFLITMVLIKLLPALIDATVIEDRPKSLEDLQAALTLFVEEVVKAHNAKKDC